MTCGTLVGPTPVGYSAYAGHDQQVVAHIPFLPGNTVSQQPKGYRDDGQRATNYGDCQYRPLRIRHDGDYDRHTLPSLAGDGMQDQQFIVSGSPFSSQQALELNRFLFRLSHIYIISRKPCPFLFLPSETPSLVFSGRAMRRHAVGDSCLVRLGLL